MKKIIKFTACMACILLFAVSCTPNQNTENSDSETQNLLAASPALSETESKTSEVLAKIKEIAASELQAISNEFTEVGSYSYDMDNDGADEKIILTINASKNSKGDFELNDGQNWQLYIKKGESCYMLIDEYVQLGSISFDVMDYYIDGKAVPTITALTKTGSMLKLTAYTYNSEKNCYVERELYNTANETDGGINKIYSSQKGLN